MRAYKRLRQGYFGHHILVEHEKFEPEKFETQKFGPKKFKSQKFEPQKFDSKKSSSLKSLPQSLLEHQRNCVDALVTVISFGTRTDYGLVWMLFGQRVLL